MSKQIKLLVGYGPPCTEAICYAPLVLLPSYPLLQYFSLFPFFVKLLCTLPSVRCFTYAWLPYAYLFTLYHHLLSFPVIRCHTTSYPWIFYRKWFMLSFSFIFFRWDYQFVKLVWTVWWSYTIKESRQGEALYSQIYQKIRNE